MDPRKKLFLLPTIAVILSTCVLLGAGPQNSLQESDLTVRIVLDKTTFALHEKVSVRIEFKNSGRKTYCFPKPTRDWTNDYPGSAVVIGQPATEPGDFESYICHFDSGGPRVTDLVSDIKQNWIKIAPNATYVTDGAEAIVDLDRQGEWQLETEYWEPQGAFHPAEIMKELKLASERAGCTVPMAPISSEPVTIHVFSATKDQH